MTGASVRFIGTGEAFDPALPNTSLLYTGRLNLLLDCGYGVPHALWRYLNDPDALDGIYLSHRHADHCFGLPALVVWMRVAGRQRPLRLFGGEGAAAWIREVLELGYEGAYAADKCFPLEFVEIVPGTSWQGDGVEMRTAVSAHSMVNHAVRIESEGRALCYSGDGAPTEATRELYAGATMLVHECYRAGPAIEGHATADELVELGRDVGVGALCLVHIERDPVTRSAVVDLLSHHARGQKVVIPTPGDTHPL